MLSRSQRLSGDQVAAILAGKTAILHTPLATIRSIVVSNQTAPRFSVIVSKKVSKSAVARNRLRRRMYHAISKVPFSSNKNYLISLKQSATLEEYLQDLQVVASRL